MILFNVVVAGFSMIASLAVALTIFTNKKLKEHPNMLIAFLSIANFLSCSNLMVYMIGTPDFVCYFSLASLYQWTYSLINPSFTLLDSIKVLSKANSVNFDVFQIIAVSLSGFSCIDMYLSFKNPFYPGSRRMKIYLIGTAIILALVGPNMKSML